MIAPSPMNDAISMWSGPIRNRPPCSRSTPSMRITLVPMPSIFAPRVTRKRARSCTCGSLAAFSMTVSPGASTAAHSTFSVAVTEASSRKMSAPRSPLGRANDIAAARVDLRAEAAEREHVGVDAATADEVAARAARSRPGRSAPSSGPATSNDARSRPDRSGSSASLADVVRAQHERVGTVLADGDPDVVEQRDHRVDVDDLRDVVEDDLLVREQARREDGQCGVLVARGHDGPGQRPAAFDDELLIHGIGPYQDRRPRTPARRASMSDSLVKNPSDARKRGRRHQPAHADARRASPTRTRLRDRDPVTPEHHQSRLRALRRQDLDAVEIRERRPRRAAGCTRVRAWISAQPIPSSHSSPASHPWPARAARSRSR